MAITVLNKSSPFPVPAGQQGFFQQDFTCQWTGTDITGTVPSGLRKVKRVTAPAIMQTVGDDEQINFTNTLNADGSLVLGTGETVSLSRTGFSPTSGLVFSFSIKGYV